MQIKPKDKEKLLAEISYACGRLGDFMQLIAYAAAPVFDENNPSEVATSATLCFAYSSKMHC